MTLRQQYPPFVVPGIEARSSSGRGRADAPSNESCGQRIVGTPTEASLAQGSTRHIEVDEGGEDDVTVSTASSSSSLESLVMNGGTGDVTAAGRERSRKHSYPPRRTRTSLPEGKTAANGLYLDQPAKSGQIFPSNDVVAGDDDEYDDDDDDDKALLDEEQRVGIMLEARDGSQSAKWWNRQNKSSTPSAPSKAASRAKTCCLLLSVALSILLFIPTLQWLSTATTRAEYEAQRTSVLSSKPQHLLEVVMPEYWRLPEAPRPTSRIHKPKRPLPDGSSKLAKFGEPFSLDFEVPAAGLEGIDASERKRQISMDDALGSIFSAETETLDWCAEDPDEGVFVALDGEGNVVLEDVTHLKHDKTGKGEAAKGGGKIIFARGQDIKSEDGTMLKPESLKISPDMKFILFFTDRKDNWRYSRRSDAWLHDVKGKSTVQIGWDTASPSIATAGWSKKGQISFVQENNLYIIQDPANPTQIFNVTNDGAKEFFNAIPDWVYEEEVFNGDTAHWWSPDGNRLVYLTFNETNVEEYTLPTYNPTPESEHALLYPKQKKLKYPKPGTPNPDVNVFVYDATTSKKYELNAPPSATIKTAQELETQTADAAMRSAGAAVLITEVKWLNDSTLILRETNRVSDAMRWLAFDCQDPSGDSITGSVGRRVSTTVSGGWVPANQDVHRVGDEATSTAYVDLLSHPHGYRHVAYFANATQMDPIFLTSGEWEVDSILFAGNGKIYFSAAYPKPSVRHILYVNIPSRADNLTVEPMTRPASLTNVEEDAWYEADFDPKGAYYQLIYAGPGIPWSKVLSLRGGNFEFTISDNADLAKRVATYVQPQRVFYNITTADGIIVSAQEIRPHDFDASGATRYPALVKVYGGPDSQIVQAKWSMSDWASYLTCTLGYIVILIDGRGTGFRGRDYRDVVTWRLGDAEATDVIAAAEAIRRLPYIAQSKVGIWGWSYGGYLTAKVIERDTGTFDLGMSVAPVTRWEFYDSIYTERYMKTPHLNKFGYSKAGVRVTKGFENSHFLLAQGSGDDNVHYQNSAHLLDMLTQNHIRGFWFRMFTDSTHSIQTRGAYRELHEFMTRFLVYNWGAGGQRIFRYQADKEDITKRSLDLRAPIALNESFKL